MTVNAGNGRIVWVDCEMTGLNPEVDALVEVAALVTDADLTVLGEGVDVVIKPPQEALDNMNDFVRSMHTESGLINEFDSGVSLEEATTAVMAYIKQWVPEARKVPLAGNSIATDRTFIAKHMPVLDEHLHYRMIDVSSIKELSKRWYPRAYFASPGKKGNHRALGDIMDSITELRYYRQSVFVPQPGPSTAECEEYAAQHEPSLEALAQPDPGLGAGSAAGE